MYSGIFTGSRPDRSFVILTELYTVCVVAAEKPTQHEWIAILLTLLYLMFATAACTCSVCGFIPSEKIDPKIQQVFVVIRIVLAVACGTVTLAESKIATGLVLLALGAALMVDTLYTMRERERNGKKNV